MISLRVEPPSALPYDVHVGRDSSLLVNQSVPEGVSKVFVVSQENIPRVDLSLDADVFFSYVENGEAAK